MFSDLCNCEVVGLNGSLRHEQVTFPLWVFQLHALRLYRNTVTYSELNSQWLQGKFSGTITR